MGQYISVGEMRRAPVVINERRISRVGNGVGLVVGAPCEVEWERRVYPGTVVALVQNANYGLVVTVRDSEGVTRRVSGDLVKRMSERWAEESTRAKKPRAVGKSNHSPAHVKASKTLQAKIAVAYSTTKAGAKVGARVASIPPGGYGASMSKRLRRIAKLSALVVASLLGVLAGCTGKSIELYHPESGKPIAKYNNTTDSDIGGLEARYNAATGDFDVRVKSSTQSASESNAAMWAAVEKLVSKIPVPTP